MDWVFNSICYSIWFLFCCCRQFWREKYLVKIKVFKMDLTVILVILMAGYARGCPKMSLCTLEETVCYFTKCSDPVLWLRLMYWKCMDQSVIDRDRSWKTLHLGTQSNGFMMMCARMYQTVGIVSVCVCVCLSV